MLLKKIKGEYVTYYQYYVTFSPNVEENYRLIFDEVTLEVNNKTVNGEVFIGFRDYCIGITPQNQKMIFGGFFHAQGTDLCSSKKAYEFASGGSGSDLLRTKIFPERYGFSVDFDGTRCTFISKDSDISPGKISVCQFVTGKDECFLSGGSVFILKFPARTIPDGNQ